VTYRDMLLRIFEALGKNPRVITTPLWLFRVAIACMRLLGVSEWSTAMVERMNVDLKFDHSAAARDFGFSPRQFRLGAADLPLSR
jgi:hypothetical protein